MPQIVSCTNNLHLNIDYRHVDIIDENNKSVVEGSLGEIAITDLENFVLPIIKYKTGDKSNFIKDTCSCGLNLPLMSPVIGRITENILIPDDGILSGEYLTTIFDNYYKQIEKFQIHQRKDYALDISIVANSNANEIRKVTDEIKKLIISKTGNRIKVDFHNVDQIENDRGKTRYIINDLINEKA